MLGRCRAPVGAQARHRRVAATLRRLALAAGIWTARLACLLLIVACGEPLATPQPVDLHAAGSMAMSELMAKLAAAFTEQNPNVSIEVIGLGTHYGLVALRRGEADLAMASWLASDPAGPGGRGVPDGWLATAIARDGIAIVVHPDNPVEGLGLLQLRDLFSGRVFDWAAVGGSQDIAPVQPVSREEGSGTRAAFEALVMEDRPVTPWAVVAPSIQAVLEYVAGHPEAIGYVSMGSLVPEVKTLAIEGEWPTPEGAQQGSYALTRDLWLVTGDAPPIEVKAFLSFVLSPAGQQIVGQRLGRIR